VPVDPPQRGPDDRALMPTPRYDVTADRFRGAAQPLVHHCRLMVLRPAAKKLDAVDADTYFRMIAQVNQVVLRAAAACTATVVDEGVSASLSSCSSPTRPTTSELR
jgi:hypothetical protein